MSKTYRAAYLAGPAQFEVREATLPDELPSGYFESEIDYCAICGSDGPFWKAAVKKNVMGHEICATVTNPGDTGFAVGQRVTMYPGIPCGKCECCKNGMDNICTQIYYVGYAGLSADGGFAQKYVGPAKTAYKVPDNISSQAACLIEPAAVAYHAVHRSKLQVGHKVLVIGAGPLGLYCGRLAQLAGASVVAVSEYNTHRLAAAKQCTSFDGYFDASDPENNAKLREFSGAAAGKGAGFDVVFECSASEAGYATAVAAAAARGEVIMIGIKNAPLPIVSQAFALKELAILPAMAYTLNEYEQTLDMVRRGVFDPAFIVTKVVGLDGIQKAFEDLFSSSQNPDLKILVKP